MVNYLPANAGDKRDEGSIPGAGRSPGGGHSHPLQHSWLSMCQWKRNASCHISKQDIAVLKSSHYSHPDGEPWGNSRLQQDACHIAVNHWSPPDHTLWGDSGWKSTGHWPQTAEVHGRGVISVSANSCIFSYIEECLITWDVWFSLINSNLLISDYLVFVAKNPVYPGPSLPSWDQSFRDIWETMSWA